MRIAAGHHPAVASIDIERAEEAAQAAAERLPSTTGDWSRRRGPGQDFARGDDLRAGAVDLAELRASAGGGPIIGSWGRPRLTASSSPVGRRCVLATSAVPRAAWRPRWPSSPAPRPMTLSPALGTSTTTSRRPGACGSWPTTGTWRRVTCAVPGLPQCTSQAPCTTGSSTSRGRVSGSGVPASC
jgi:hypothetical protein